MAGCHLYAPNFVISSNGFAGDSYSTDITVGNSPGTLITDQVIATFSGPSTTASVAERLLSLAEKPMSGRAKEDARLLRLIRASFKSSQGVYGAPRVFLDLREAGETCSKHRVARLMRAVAGSIYRWQAG